MPVLGLLSLLPLEESTHPQLFCRTLLFAQPQIRRGTNRRAQRAATNAPKQSVSPRVVDVTRKWCKMLSPLSLTRQFAFVQLR